MFDVVLQVVCGVHKTADDQTYYLSMSKDFYCPMSFKLNASDDIVKLAVAKNVGNELNLDWKILNPKFCGLQKVGHNILQVIYYIRLPVDFNQPNKITLMHKNQAAGSDCVRKVQAYV